MTETSQEYLPLALNVFPILLPLSFSKKNTFCASVGVDIHNYIALHGHFSLGKTSGRR